MSFATAASQKSVWGFSPQSIPGLQLWLDGADTTSITGTSSVTAWRNKGAAGGSTSTTLGSGTVSSTSTTINGLPTVSFAGSAYMTAPSMTFAQTTRTVFIVVKLGASGLNRYFLQGNASISTNRINVGVLSYFYSGITDLEMSYYGDGFYGTTGTPTIFNTSTIICATTLSTNYGIFVNGTSQALVGGGTTRAFETGTTTTQAIGYNGAGSASFDLGEVMIFDGAITDTQRQQVEGYLAAKWGLGMNLPPTHPYSSVIPILPTQISGCQLWLDAADTSTITGTSSVTAWADKSGNGNTATSSGTANPVLTQNLINGVQGISFPNTGTSPNPTYYFDGPISLTGTSITSFVVCVPSSVTVTAASPPRILSLAAAGAVDYTSALYFVALYQYLTSFAVYRYSGGNIATVAANTPYVISTVATPGNLAGYQNGVGPTNITAGVPSGNFSVSRFRIANEFNPATSLFNGNIGEVIVFNTALSTSQRQQIESYLGRKWGIGVTNTTVAPGRYLIPTNRPFYPTDIGGCLLWLDAADRSSIVGTSPVTSWVDKSGTGNTMTITTGNVTYTTNPPAVVFPNAQVSCRSALSTNVITAGSSGFFMVLQNTAMSAAAINMAFTCVNILEGGLYAISMRFDANNVIRATNVGDIGSNYYVNGTLGVIGGTYNNQITVPAGSNVIDTIFNLGGTTQFALSVGNYVDAALVNRFFIGNIQEVIVYTGPITTSQRQQVEQYLAWKWGLVANLPPATSHPGKLLPAFSTAFTPKSLTGLQLWLDGADQSSMTFSSGSSVSSWNDKSGNGYNFTNNGGSTNPTTDPKMGLLFTTTRSFANSSVPIPSNYTLFLVGNLTSRPSSYGRMINMNTTTDGFGFLGTFNNSFNFATFTGPGGATWYDTNSNTPTSTVASSPNLSIMGMTISATSLTPFFDGNVLNSKTNSGSTASTTGMCLNGISFAGQGVNAHFAEVFLFNSPLSTSQRQQVEGYLAWKWGLQSSLPSTHAYAKFSP